MTGPRFTLPLSELEIAFSRSGGPGGQNVNKVETRVQVRWHLGSSAALTEYQRQVVRTRLERLLTKDDQLLVTDSSTRSQDENRARAIARLEELVRAALIPPKRRRPTKVPYRERARRHESKRHHATRKANRGRPRGDD